MECNKDEATRAKEIAEYKMKIDDFQGARKFLFKAQQMYPQLEDINQLLMVCNVHCSAQTKLNGGKDMDFYGILQIERFSDEASVKKQYRKLALSLHPDKNKFPGAEAAFKLIGEAHMVLTDPAKRSLYDIKCGVPARPPILKHAFHQSNQFFHAMKKQQDLNEASGVPCSRSSSLHTFQQSSSVNLSDRSLGSKERKTEEDEKKSENVSKTGFDTRPPEKDRRRKPEVESRGASDTGTNDDESKRKKPKESAAMAKPDSRKPKEDDYLKTKNASKKGFSELKTGNSSKISFGSRPQEKASRQADKKAESSTSKHPSRKRGRVPKVESSEGFDAERNDDKSNGLCKSVKIVLGLRAGKLYDSKRKKNKNYISAGHQKRKSARLMQNVSKN